MPFFVECVYVVHFVAFAKMTMKIRYKIEERDRETNRNNIKSFRLFSSLSPLYCDKVVLMAVRLPFSYHSFALMQFSIRILNF